MVVLRLQKGMGAAVVAAVVVIASFTLHHCSCHGMLMTIRMMTTCREPEK